MVVDFKGAVGSYSDVAVDDLGNPHMSYYDSTYPQFGLKYATVDNPFKPPSTEGVTISPPEFPYKVTIEIRCAESLAGICLRREIVRTCVGGNCFDSPPRTPGGPCVRCTLAAVGMATAALLAVGLAWRRRQASRAAN